MENIVFKSCDKDITKDLPLSRNIIPCAQCGSKERKLGCGKGPHTASLRCAVCDRFIKWIGKAELGRIAATKGVQR